MRVAIFVLIVLLNYCNISAAAADEYSAAISSAIAALPKIKRSTFAQGGNGNDPEVNKVLHVSKLTDDNWKLFGKSTEKAQKAHIQMMSNAGYFKLITQLLNHPLMLMKNYAAITLQSLLLLEALNNEKMNELNRQFVDVLFDEGIVTRLIELAISEDPSDNESFTLPIGLNDGTNSLRNAKEEASYAVVSIVFFARPGKLMHKLVHVGARDAVCQAARTYNENSIFVALESASLLNFQQKERGIALKDPENIMFYVALCNATENFCSHYDCVGSPHDGKEINIDKKYVEEDLSCEGVDKDTCVKRAAQNHAKAEASSDDEDDQMKTFIVDEWYRVPGKLDKWKYGVNVLGLFAAHSRSEKSGAPIIGSQDPNSPLKLQKVFDMLGRDDCCDISEDMLDQLYHRKDVVRYIVDTLYDDNPNFLAEMKEKEDERIRKEKEEEKDASTKVDAKTVAADYVDLHIKRSEPGKDGEDHSHVYAIFLQCLWVMADDPVSSLQISDVWDMLEKDGSFSLESNPRDFVDVMKLEGRDVVEYMVLTLVKDFGGPLGFAEKMTELMENRDKLPLITQANDISGVCQVLVDQLLEIKKKNFELFRLAVFNVLLPQAPEDTFGTVAYALSCRKWTDKCLHKLAERSDVMHMIFFELIRRHEDGTAPITTKERLTEELDVVLYNASVVTFDPRAILQNATYFVYLLLAAVVILLYKSWQNKKKMDAEKKMREEAETVARKERDKKKSKKKKWQ